MHHTSLNTALAEIRANLSVVAHLAPHVEEIRYERPEGYGARPDSDGVSRPVEQIVLATDDRGVSRHVQSALYELNVAAIASARAAHALDAAQTAWEHNR